MHLKVKIQMAFKVGGPDLELLKNYKLAAITILDLNETMSLENIKWRDYS